MLMKYLALSEHVIEYEKNLVDFLNYFFWP